jgi:hypothetical protein
LREIVEFAFATSLLALGTIPMAELAGDSVVAFRLLGAFGVAYIVLVIVVLEVRRRGSRLELRASPAWIASALVLNLAVLGAGLVALATGSAAIGEFMLLGLLARPMAAFLLVLARLGQTGAPPSASLPARPRGARNECSD